MNKRVICLAVLTCFLLSLCSGLFGRGLKSLAEDPRVELRFEEKEYGEGDTVTFRAVITDAAGMKLSGGFLAEFQGLSVMNVLPDDKIKAEVTAGNNSVSVALELTGKEVPEKDGSLILCDVFCKTAGPESVAKMNATLTLNNVTRMQGEQVYVLPRIAGTEGPSESPTAKPTASPSEEPTKTPEPTETPTAAPWETNTPVPENTPLVTEVPGKETPETTQGGIVVPEEQTRTETGDPTAAVGSIVFWAVVALVAGIWIGIGIGALLWRKKSVFMTEEEKKIIGKY